MPLATPTPSGEWQAATSVQASLIFGAGAAIAGEKTWRPSTPPAVATPTAPAVLRRVRRDGRPAAVSFVMVSSVVCALDDSRLTQPFSPVDRWTRRPLRRAPVPDLRE